jgi:hypothetical protein
MYFIENHKNLIGKTIAFFHTGQFADAMVMGTADGGILVAKPEPNDDFYDEDGISIKILSEVNAEKYIFKRKSNEWMVKDMANAGVFTQGEYEIFLRDRVEEFRIAQEEAIKKKEEKELQEYMRLKEKFGDKQ